MELLLLGGDRRMLYTAGRLSALGHSVRLGCFEPQPGFSGIRLVPRDAWREAVRDAQAIVLPLFARGKGGSMVIQAPFTDREISAEAIAQTVLPSQAVLAGMPPDEVRRVFFGRGLALLDYFARDELAVFNAVPTAQGVIALMIENLETAVACCRVCLTGYGRCSRALARALRGLGTRVSVAARKKRDLAQILVDGYEPLPLDKITDTAKDFDALINTVPSQILPSHKLSDFRRDCLLIEIASAPFGIDADAAENLGMTYIYAPSLPGKTAPKTAGEIIADTVDNMLNELKTR